MCDDLKVKCISTLKWQFATVCGKAFHIDETMECSACEDVKPSYYDQETSAFYCENDKPASAEKVVFTCSEGHPLIRVKKDSTRRPHFRHEHRADMQDNHTTKWHLDWQSMFTDCRIEYHLPMLPGQIKPRWADIYIESIKQTVEIQYSPPNDSMEERSRDHELHFGKMPVWVVFCDATVEDGIMTFRSPDTWQVKEFTFSDFVYYDVDGRIYKVNPRDIRDGQVRVNPSKNQQLFVDAIKGGRDLWAEEESLPQFSVEILQQGAGSGKTYGLMQRIPLDFAEKYSTIIFLTKQHSAKEVMFAEFKKQHHQVKSGLVVDSITPLQKKYVVKCRVGLKLLTVVFATVDSFMFAIATESKGFDLIHGWVDCVCEGKVKLSSTGIGRFAGESTQFGPKTMIVGDEFQDLHQDYGKAFLNFVEKHNTNICAVGDRLQSLTFEKSALTFMQDHATVKTVAQNVVRRFGHPQLIDFVNDLVDFGNRDLPKMSVEEPKLYENPLMFLVLEDEIDRSETTVRVGQIMKYYKQEVDENGRSPEDFLIVSPFISNNPVMLDLWIAINDFWEIRRELCSRPRFKYAIQHESNEGSSINLTMSDRATRMVSIHSSKGDGRPVVFLVGLDHTSLLRYSLIPTSIVYDSLLHVAVTRQKERLYVCMTGRKDTLTDKIRDWGAKHNLSIDRKPIYKPISRYISSNKMLSNFCQNMGEEFKQHIMDAVPQPDFIENGTPEIIDMRYHAIRFGSMAMNVYIECLNSLFRRRRMEQKQIEPQSAVQKVKVEPLIVIFWNLSKLKIKEVKNNLEYKAVLRENKQLAAKRNPIHKDSGDGRFIPLLVLNPRDASDLIIQHCNTIKDTIKQVQCIIAEAGMKHMPHLNALQCVILHYMIEVVDKNVYSDLNIHSVYEVVDLLSKRDTLLACHFNELDTIGPKLRSFVTHHPNAKWSYHNPVFSQTDQINLFCKEHYFVAECEPAPAAELETPAEVASVETDVLPVKPEPTVQYIFYLKPTFSQLSYHQTVFLSLVDAAITRFLNGKNAVSVVASFTHEGLYEIDWNKCLTDSDWETLRPMVEKSAVNYLTSNFDLLHDKLMELNEKYSKAKRETDENDTAETQAAFDEACEAKDEFTKNHNANDIEAKYKNVPDFVYKAIIKFFRNPTKPTSKEVFIQQLTLQAKDVCHKLFTL
jgi:hypothetical protein